MKCANERELARFVSGLVEPEAAAALREHLEHCPRCQAIATSMSAATARLGPDPGELDAPDLVGDVMVSIRRGAAESRATVKPRRLVWLWIPMAAVAATALLLVVRPFGSSGEADGFQRRGAPAANPDSWVSVEAFRATPAGYQRVGDQIAADDALAFAYVNPGDEGYRYLNVFAVDGQGGVFWYYPAPAGEAGGGLPIARTRRSELPEEIRHELRPGPLRIFAMFSKEPRVRALIEQIVRRDLREARVVKNLHRLRVAGTGQHTLLLTVTAPGDASPGPGAK